MPETTSTGVEARLFPEQASRPVVSGEGNPSAQIALREDDPRVPRCPSEQDESWSAHCTRSIDHEAARCADSPAKLGASTVVPLARRTETFGFWPAEARSDTACIPRRTRAQRPFPESGKGL